MSLTNYVSQSVIGSLIFSRMPWGWLPTAGIWSVCGRLCRHDRTDMVLPLVAGQHRYGVLEGLWHRATWLAAGKVSAPEHR